MGRWKPSLAKGGMECQIPQPQVGREDVPVISMAAIQAEMDIGRYYRLPISAKSLVSAKHDFPDLPLPDNTDLYTICTLDYYIFMFLATDYKSVFEVDHQLHKTGVKYSNSHPAPLPLAQNLRFFISEVYSIPLLK